MVWFPVTFEKRYETGVGFWVTLSTTTEETEYPMLGMNVNVCELPCVTETEPVGEIEPPVPAEAVMVCVTGGYTQLSLT